MQTILKFEKQLGGFGSDKEKTIYKIKWDK